MLKFLKIFPFLIVCFYSLKAQKDTFYLTDKKVCIGKIYKDYGDMFDVDTEKGPAIIRTKKIYKIVKADGNVVKYTDLTFLESGLSKENYRKVLKPLTATSGVFGQKLYYGGFHISRHNFFEALDMIQDDEIHKNLKRYKKKNATSLILVPMGWGLQTAGFFSMLLFAPDIHFRNGGVYYYSDESRKAIYAGSAVMLAGLTEVVIGYVQAYLARKIKKRKLIDRYNSLILQP